MNKQSTDSIAPNSKLQTYGGKSTIAQLRYKIKQYYDKYYWMLLKIQSSTAAYKLNSNTTVD